MAHTRPIQARIVRLSPNKKAVFACLLKAMTQQGLKPEEMVDVTPGAETPEKDLVAQKQYFDVAGKIGSWFTNPTCRELPQFTLMLGGKEKKLFEKFNAEWLTHLETHAKKDAEENESLIINSHRVLITQLYSRLFAQAVRDNSTLSADKRRVVWLAIMQQFTELLLSKDHLNHIAIDPAFRTVITDMNKKWGQTLTEVVDRIEDINRANSIVRQNTSYLDELSTQVKRFIIVELAGKENANETWSGSISSAEYVKITLKKYEKKWIAEHQEEIDEKEDTSENQGKISDLLNAGLLTDEEAERQRKICSICSERLRKLYALNNFTEFLESTVSDIGTAIKIAAWVPLLLEGFRFEKLDQKLITHKKEFDLLTDSQFLTPILGTNLQQELLQHITRVSRFGMQKLPPFMELKNPILLDRIGNELRACMDSLKTKSELLGCQVVSTRLITAASQFVPTLIKGKALPASKPAHKPLLALASSASRALPTLTEPSRQSSDSVELMPLVAKRGMQAFKNPFAAVPPRDTRVALEDDDESVSAEEIEEDTKKYIEQFEIGSTDVMQTRYIDVFLTQCNIKTKFNKAFANYLAGKPVSFLTAFDSDQHFQNASRLVKDVRAAVQKFIADVFVHEPVEPKTGHLYWRMRREEIFCLKFLCVAAVTKNSDTHLLNFLRTLYINATTAFAMNLFSRRFNGLVDALKAVVDEIDKTPSYRIVQGDASTTSAKDEQANKAEIVKLKQDMLTKDAQLVAKTVEVKKKETALAKKDKEIVALRAENKGIKDELQTVKKENESLTTQIETLVGQLEEVQAHGERLEEELASTKEELHSHKGNLSSAQKDWKETQLKLVELQRASQEKDRQVDARFQAILAQLEVKTREEKMAMDENSLRAIQEKDEKIAALKKELDETLKSPSRLQGTHFNPSTPQTTPSIDPSLRSDIPSPQPVTKESEKRHATSYTS